MFEPKLGGGCRDMLGLERVDRSRHAGFDVAERACARAGVSKNHHRSVFLGPAFANIRARRFLTHGREIKLAHQATCRMIAFADRRLDADPVWLALLGRNGGGSIHGEADSDCCNGLPPLLRAVSREPCLTSSSSSKDTAASVRTTGLGSVNAGPSSPTARTPK